MTDITIKTTSGADAGTVTLDADTFGIQPNVPVMHQVVTAQLASARAGTQSTKTRSEVRGGGAKPYRQKGTGRARQGSIRAPHYAGGGVAHGPKPRSYAQRTPKKMIKLALRSALSDRANVGKVLVVDSWGFDAPSTKAAAGALQALGTDGKVLVVVERDDTNTELSFRNLPEAQVLHVGELNAYDVLCNDWIVFTQATLDLIGAGTEADRAAEAATGVGGAGASATGEGSATAEGSASDEADSAAEAAAPASIDEPDGAAEEAAPSKEKS